MSIKERLQKLSATNPETGCREWLACLRPNGYGQLVVGSRKNGTRKNSTAHVQSFIAHKGPVPAGMQVLHTCDNRKCINPEHLYAGTSRQNALDRDSRGRNGRQKLTPENIQFILTSPLGQKKLGKILGVHPSTIYHVRKKHEKESIVS